MANIPDKADRGKFVKFTQWALLAEVLLFAVAFCFPDMHAFFPVWLFCTAIVNFVLVIVHIIEKPKLFLLYIALLFAVPIIPIAILLSVMGRMGC